MHNGFFRYILSVAFITLGGSDAISGELPEVKLLEADFEEFLRDSANISGAVVAGLQRQGSIADSLELGAYVPVDWAGSNTCMQIVSSDGRYEAHGPYAIPIDWPGGYTSLDFPTEYLSELSLLKKDELGALLSKGTCSDRKNRGISVVIWNTMPAQKYTLLVNSFRADQVFLYKEGQSAPILCDRVDVASPISFDTKCEIALGKVAEESVFTVYRVKNGKPSSPTEVAIWLPVEQ
jgi:hypothetical protein